MINSKLQIAAQIVVLLAAMSLTTNAQEDPSAKVTGTVIIPISEFAWASIAFMSGPLVICWFEDWDSLAKVMGYVYLGFLAIPLIISHVVKPTPVTTGFAIIGLFLWFLASYITIIVSMYAG